MTNEQAIQALIRLFQPVTELDTQEIPVVTFIPDEDPDETQPCIPVEDNNHG